MWVLIPVALSFYQLFYLIPMCLIYWLYYSRRNIDTSKFEFIWFTLGVNSLSWYFIIINATDEYFFLEFVGALLFALVHGLTSVWLYSKDNLNTWKIYNLIIYCLVLLPSLAVFVIFVLSYLISYF